SHGSELVTPKRLSKGRLVQLEEEGTYECSVTGLVFEASERVLVRYSVLSWSKFGAFLHDSWKFAGPIFNVDTVNKDASVLKSIQFPHSICLADTDNDMTFSVLHIKGNRPVIEPTVDHSGSHVKWNVTSLSPVGPIIQTSQAVEHHGVVLVYKQLTTDNNSYSFHVYLGTNSASDIKELKFTLAVTKMKGYFEAFFEQHPPFKLSLIEINTEETVWSATIREGRQRSSSPSEDELAFKRTRMQDEPSEKQLLQVAKRLGKEWKQVAIFLDVTSKELDNIQTAETDVTMQKLKMLLMWKNRNSGEATARNLLESVKELDDLPNE
uniref:Si:dkeyp-97b10.3 n=2 Tax=Haplochromini TaxID=319058 RepID=A0A3B4FFG5_9CICH